MRPDRATSRPRRLARASNGRRRDVTRGGSSGADSAPLWRTAALDACAQRAAREAHADVNADAGCLLVDGLDGLTAFAPWEHPHSGRDAGGCWRLCRVDDTRIELQHGRCEKF